MVARAFLHMWEEPCISGTRGSGAVFFSGCSLKCIYCQNHEISHEGRGREITVRELANLFISLRDKGAHNINLVTPTHFGPAIREALSIAKGHNSLSGQANAAADMKPDPASARPTDPASGIKPGRTSITQADPASDIKPGRASITQADPASDIAEKEKGQYIYCANRTRPLDIPVVYNTNGYDRTTQLRLLEEHVDVYLPDLKYISPEVSKEYSGVSDYFDKASSAVLEMYRQKGEPVFDSGGMIKKGVIIRHLVLPGHTSETLRVLDWISENISSDAYVSLMSQYVPCHMACVHSRIGRHITRREYDKVVNGFLRLGLNGFVQERESASEEFIPDFDMDLY